MTSRRVFLVRWLRERADLTLMAITFLAVGVVIENANALKTMRQAFRSPNVPTSLLDSGARGDLLKQLGLLKRIPNDGSRWQASHESSDARSWFGNKARSEAFLYTPVSSRKSKVRYVVIAEWQVANAGELFDVDGDCPDWIELWNPGDAAIDVTGWHLTDDVCLLDKWTFPEGIVPADGRLLVFASAKDKAVEGELHTNFRLAKDGEYLALVQPDGETIVHEFKRTYQKTYPGVSYGIGSDGVGQLATPTPGSDNSHVLRGVVREVEFAKESCLFEAAFRLRLASSTPGATIRYTLDGSEPSESSGKIYEGPLTVDKTTVVRASAAAPGLKASVLATRSYLHLESLLHQPARPRGFPAAWNEMLADYEMDARIVEEFEQEVKLALSTLPILSVVAEGKDFFGERGIYSNTRMRGMEWERKAAIELLSFRNEPGFRAVCGLRILGNEGRDPEAKKHSFRLSFRKQYGQSHLRHPLFTASGTDRFDSLVLRSSDDSWVYHEEPVREHAQFIRDQWSRQTEIDMGRLSARGRWVHVCLNGLYWGIYNLVERPDANFLAHQLGGYPQDYITFRTRGDQIDADARGERVWDEISSLVEQGLEHPKHYRRMIRNHLDVVDFVDYCLIHFYNAGEDWALTNGNNLRVYRHAGPKGRLRFLTWDADSTFASGWNNDSYEFDILPLEDEDPSSPAGLFECLCSNRAFRRLFARRVSHWFFGSAALSRNACRRRYTKLLDTVGPALMAESARWGDVRRHEPYTPHDSWTMQKEWMLQEWFPKRTQILLDQFTDAGLYWPR